MPVPLLTPSCAAALAQALPFLRMQAHDAVNDAALKALIADIEAALAAYHHRRSAEFAQLTIAENGDANSYAILDGNRWVANVLVNGELTVEQQRKFMASMVARDVEDLIGDNQPPAAKQRLS